MSAEAAPAPRGSDRPASLHGPVGPIPTGPLPILAPMLDTVSLEREVRRFLAENFPLGENADTLAGNDALLEAGVIDSTGVLELVGFLESRFGIVVSDEELLPENLDSIDRIVGYLESKLGTS